MNLIEAIRSGNKFKRKEWKEYSQLAIDVLDESLFFEIGEDEEVEFISLGKDELLADDYEVKEY